MRILQWIVVTICSIIFATLSLNAYDNLGQMENSLLASIFLGGAEKDPCPENMVYVSVSDGVFCIDAYENSVNEFCLHKNPSSELQTTENLALPECKPVSVKNAMPWRNIARHQAEIACAKVNKRLPSSDEWFKSALGTPDTIGSTDNNKKACNTNNNRENSPDLTGNRDECASAVNAYDMIGNVWEWTEEIIFNGELKGRKLPQSGYVDAVDSNGVAITTNHDTPSTAYYNDYFSIDHTGARGVFRGGFWKSNTDAGLYAINMMVPSTFVGDAVGFRCASSF